MKHGLLVLFLSDSGLSDQTIILAIMFMYMYVCKSWKKQSLCTISVFGVHTHFIPEPTQINFFIVHSVAPRGIYVVVADYCCSLLWCLVNIPPNWGGSAGYFLQQSSLQHGASLCLLPSCCSDGNRVVIFFVSVNPDGELIKKSLKGKKCYA